LYLIAWHAQQRSQGKKTALDEKFDKKRKRNIEKSQEKSNANQNTTQVSYNTQIPHMSYIPTPALSLPINNALIQNNLLQSTGLNSINSINTSPSFYPNLMMYSQDELQSTNALLLNNTRTLNNQAINIHNNNNALNNHNNNQSNNNGNNNSNNTGTNNSNNNNNNNTTNNKNNGKNGNSTENNNNNNNNNENNNENSSSNDTSSSTVENNDTNQDNNSNENNKSNNGTNDNNQNDHSDNHGNNNQNHTNNQSNTGLLGNANSSSPLKDNKITVPLFSKHHIPFNATNHVTSILPPNAQNTNLTFQQNLQPSVVSLKPTITHYDGQVAVRPPSTPIQSSINTTSSTPSYPLIIDQNPTDLVQALFQPIVQLPNPINMSSNFTDSANTLINSHPTYSSFTNQNPLSLTPHLFTNPALISPTSVRNLSINRVRPNNVNFINNRNRKRMKR